METDSVNDIDIENAVGLAPSQAKAHPKMDHKRNSSKHMTGYMAAVMR